ncbi:MAG: nucleoside phosphorylase [Desulfobaccales bacterium]
MPTDTKKGAASLPPDQALINPTREPGEAAVAPRVILAFTRPDYQNLCRLSHAAGPPRYLFDCAVHEGSWEGKDLTVVGPALGAPYAVMILERLIALGAKVVLALGWCGSLQSRVQVGSLVIPTTAVGSDGTSPHYLAAPGQPAPDPQLCGLLQARMEAAEIPWHAGAIWTTDAFYRETVALVSRHQAQGVLGVDLELAALFAVGQFRQVAVAGLLVVSDELAELTWRPGFHTPAFKQGRRVATRVVLDVAAAAEI